MNEASRVGSDNAVILGNRPEECGHIYPTTRDGRCHGCGATLVDIYTKGGGIKFKVTPAQPQKPEECHHSRGTTQEGFCIECGTLMSEVGGCVPLGGPAPPTINPRHLSADPEHFTPIAVVEAARKTLVEIDLDPSTTSYGNASRVKAKSFFSASDNGYAREWSGRVFMNPPGGKCDRNGVCLYPVKGQGWTCNPAKVPCGHDHGSNSQSAQKAWWQKLAQAWEAGKVEAAIFIGFSVEVLQTTQVKPVGPLPLEFPLCVPKNRLAYDREIRSEDGSVQYKTGESPPHASVVVFLPPLGSESITRLGSNASMDTNDAVERFVEAFSPIGHVSVPWRWR